MCHKIEVFREKFCEHVAAHHEPAGDDFEVAVDAEVRLADCQFNAVRELDRLGPFGQCNKRPIFVSSNVELAGKPRTMGEGGRHPLDTYQAIRCNRFCHCIWSRRMGRRNRKTWWTDIHMFHSGHQPLSRQRIGTTSVKRLEAGRG